MASKCSKAVCNLGGIFSALEREEEYRFLSVYTLGEEASLIEPVQTCSKILSSVIWYVGQNLISDLIKKGNCYWRKRKMKT